jgi:CRISPR type I-D-associated protein Csc2
MTQVKVPAETEFLGVVTLRDPTKDAAKIVVDALERTTRIGASTREWGRCKTIIEGYRLADREELASYELAGKTPGDLSPLAQLELESDGKKAFENFAKACTTVLKDFGGKKKATK